jgi:ATP-binding cassette subfamily B multidrug efflux pump
MHFREVLHPFFIDYISKRKFIYFLGLIAVVFCNFAQVYFARAIGYLIDFFTNRTIPKMFEGMAVESVFTWLFLSIVASQLILMLGRYGWRMTMARQTHKASGHLKQSIWSNALYFPMSDFSDDFSKGNLMNLANSDVNQARFIFGFTLVGLTDVVFLGLFSLGSMFQYHVKFSILATTVLFFVPFVVRKIASLEIEKYEEAQETLSFFNDLASQSVTTLKLQKLGKIADFWFQRLMNIADKYRLKRLDSQYVSLRYIPFMGFSSLVSYLVLFSYGIVLIRENQISVGDFLALQGLIFLLQDPLVEIGYIISEWFKSVTSLKRLEAVTNNNQEDYLKFSSDLVADGNVAYEVRNLTFSYGDNKILDNFTLTVKHGQRIGISGKIGTGKTTLMNILSGLERKFNGQVHFFGHEFDYYSHQLLRENIIYVHQNPFLFASSIRDNIILDRELNDETVWECLELAGLADDIRGFKDGLNTQLGEWGINLSGGQKQRLTLARALSYRPKVLILDDVLSAVDTVTEDKILSNLSEHLKDTTIIWVAHRSSTLKYCRQIINMDKL